MIKVSRLGGLYDQGENKHQMGSVWDKNGIAPTIDTMSSGSYHFLEEKFFAVDEQNMLLRSDTIGTLTTDGNSPKHNNRVAECQQIKIKQATEQGFAMCDIGGGGGLELHRKPNKARKSNREREDLPDNNNGEYP